MHKANIFCAVNANSATFPIVIIPWQAPSMPTLSVMLFLPRVLCSQPLDVPLVDQSPARRDNALWLIVLAWASVIRQNVFSVAFFVRDAGTSADSIGKLDAGDGCREGVRV